MLKVSSVILFLIATICSGQSASRACQSDTVDFATKVDKSPIVVYGKAMAKTMNSGSESVFHVFFQVDCILKGPATLRQINITNAGHVEGKTYCQDFPVGRGYSIAFLEPSPLNTTDRKTFIPTDFAEIVDRNNSTITLLAQTCNLNRIVPLQSLASAADVCPPVGTDRTCLETSTKIIQILQTNVPVNLTIDMSDNLVMNSSNQTIPIKHDDEHHSHPIHSVQQELETIKSKSNGHQVDVDAQNNSVAMPFNFFLIVAAIFYCLY